jgi:uncharacterized membrane protein YjfL (UPF0719 family)
MDMLKVIGINVLYAVIAVVFAWVAKKVADVMTTKVNDDKEIEENNNLAIGISRAGLYLGGLVAMAGVLTGPSVGLKQDLIGLGVYGVLAYVLLFVARRINDSVLLSGIDNVEACKDGNKAVGIVEFGSYVATGLIINACVSGDGGGLKEGLIGTLVFFAIGQALILILMALYEAGTPFKAKEEIRQGNAAAAIMVAGKSIALAVILRASILGPSTGFAEDIKAFGISAAVGIVLLMVFNRAIDHLFLPGTNLKTEVERDKNVAAVTVTQVSTIGVALILSMVV